jgi:hypothetical protein
LTLEERKARLAAQDEREEARARAALNASQYDVRLRPPRPPPLPHAAP